MGIASPSSSPKSGVSSPQARPPLGQDIDSAEVPPSCVPSGWMVRGVATQLARMPLEQDMESEELPPSNVLSGGCCLVLHVKWDNDGLLNVLDLWELQGILYG